MVREKEDGGTHLSNERLPFESKLLLEQIGLQKRVLLREQIVEGGGNGQLGQLFVFIVRGLQAYKHTTIHQSLKCATHCSDCRDSLT